MAATDERAIHEFPTGTIDDNSLLIMDRPTLTPGEYETEKFAIANLALKILGGIDFPNNLDTDEQDIFGAINEVNAKAMNTSDEYDETASYSKGDYCIYQNAAYRCVKASGTTTGTFVAADWTQIKVLAEVKANTEEIDELKTNKQDEIIPTVLNNNLTYHSNCSIQNGFIIRYGRIVEVGMILKTTGNINNNDIIVSGLPRALLNRRCPRGLGTDQWFANTDYTSGGLAVDADEQDQTKAIIRNFANITASSSSPKYIYMSFSYVTMT